MRGVHRRLVIRRARHQRLILATTAATALVALTVLASLATYTVAAPDAGRRAALLAEPPTTTSVTVSTAFGTQGLDALDGVVKGATAATFGELPVGVHLTAQSIGYDVAAHPGHPTPAIAELVYLDGVANHADLLDGRWPADTPAPIDSPIEIAVPQSVATALDVTVGTTTQLTSRLTEIPVDVVVTGVYRARDPAASFWLAEPFHNTGVRELTFTTYGPLLVSRAAFTEHFADSATVSWQILPDFAAATTDQVAMAAHRLPAMRSAVSQAAGFGSSVTFTSTLEQVVAGQERAALVARSALMIPLALLVILATCALLLATRMVAEYRRRETALMRARGASQAQLVGHAMREGLLLVVPAAVVATAAAAVAIRLIAGAALFTSVGVHLRTTPQAATWVALALGSVGCIATFILPWLRGADSSLTSLPAQGRAAGQAGIQRAGLDLALAALAGLAYWQLLVMASAAGQHASDPLLVVAPALLVLAGAALAVRLLPLVAHLGERIALRGSGLAAVVGAAQVARRAGRYSGVVLLVTLALAAGTLSTVYGATWRVAQQDQADYQVGADLRVENALVRGAVLPLGQAAAYQGLPGVQAVLPVLREVSDADKARPVVLLGVDAVVAPDVMVWRGDLRPASVRDLMAPLAQGRPSVPGVPLPGSPERVEVSAQLAASAAQEIGPAGTDFWNARLSMILTDNAGLLHVVDLGALPADGAALTLAADLSELAGGPAHPPSWPLSITGFALSYEPLGDDQPPVLALRIAAVRVAESAGAPARIEVAVPAGLHWSGAATAEAPGAHPPSLLDVAPMPGAWVAARADSGSASAALQTSRNRLVLSLGMPLPAAGAVVAGGRQLAPVAGIVTRGLLTAGQSAVGDTIAVPFHGGQLPVRIVDVVDALPTVPARSDGVLVDLQSVATAAFAASGSSPSASEWWLATGSQGADAAHQALAGDPTLGAHLQDRHALTDTSRHDPFAAGARGALVMGFAAAAVFAAVGFAVNAAITARERRPEFALLRALGASPRQLGGMIAIEQATVVGLAALAGLALGAVAARGVLPLVIVSADAERAVPDIAVTVPWAPLALLVAGTVAAFGVVIGAVLRSTRRMAGEALETDR